MNFKLFGRFIFMAFVLVLSAGLFYEVAAQCSICTMTAQQMGEKPAKGMNSGIIYLMMTPLAVMGVIGYKWVKKEYSKSDK